MMRALVNFIAALVVAVIVGMASGSPALGVIAFVLVYIAAGEL